MDTYRVGYLVGSLAKDSINRKLARALKRLAPPALQLSEIPFADLPHYSYDYDAAYPPAPTAFKEAIAGVDAVLFVTPEYNRSIPGALRTRSTGRAGRTARTVLPGSLRPSSVRHLARSALPSASSTCAASWHSATRP